MLNSTKSVFGPLVDCDRIFQNLYGRHDWRLKGAIADGEWYRTADLIAIGPQWIIDEVKRSGLRGLWQLCGQQVGMFAKGGRQGQGRLIINCAEGEPGTCKDREILLFRSFAKGEAVTQMLDFADIIRKKMTNSAICGLCDRQSNMAGSLIQHLRPLIEARVLQYAN